MNASVVIPTFNKRPYLAETLKSLASQKDAPEFQVIVVDDGSTDGTQDLVTKLRVPYPLHCVRNPVNFGRAKTRNVGLAQAEGDIVIFLDDDRPVNDEFVSHHLQSGGPGKIVVGRRFEFIQDHCTEPSTASPDSRCHYKEEEIMKMTAMWQWPLRSNWPLAWFSFATGNLSAWRRDVLDAGAFDENFGGWGHEDSELGYRMSSEDLFYIYEPRAENFHLIHPKSPSHLKEKYETWRYFYQKHPYRDVELLLPFIAKRISFQFYLAEVFKSIKKQRKKQSVDPLFDDDYFSSLRDDFVLADEIRAGRDVILSLSGAVKLIDQSDGILLGTADYRFEFRGVEKDIVARFDGQTLLSSIVEATCSQSQSAPDKFLWAREFVSSLVINGILECTNAHD